MKGVYISFLGAVIAAVGAVVSSRQAEKSKEEQLELSKKLVAKGDELNAKNDALLAVTKESATAVLAAQREVVAATQRSAAKSEENASLSRELAAYATGGNSFFYLHINDFGLPTHEAKICTVGKYPVRDTMLNVFDVSQQFPAIADHSVSNFDLKKEGRIDEFVQIAYPVHKDRILGSFPFSTSPTKDSYVYFVYITNATGRFRELIHLVKIGDSWKQAYIVERLVDGGKNMVEAEHFDTGYLSSGPRLVRMPLPSEGEATDGSSLAVCS